MTKVLFLCHGNICRSPMAELMMKEMVRGMGLEAEFHIESAATSREEIGSDIHRGTRASWSSRESLLKRGMPAR